MNEKVIHTKKLHREVLKRYEDGETYRSIEKNTQVNKSTIKKWVVEGKVFDDGCENWKCPHCGKEFVHYPTLKLHAICCVKNPVHRSPTPHTTYKHTQESKKKISDARKKHLKLNPQNHTYNTLRHTESYPEKYFTEVFTNAGLNFQREVHCGTYSLDFYFPDYQVDFETDGEQHYTDERIIESDKNRTEYLKQQNIETVRIRWALFKKIKDVVAKENFIKELISDITNRKISEKTSAVLYNLDLENKITEYIVGKNKTYIDVIRAIGLPEKCKGSVIYFIKRKNYKLNTIVVEAEPNIKCECCPKCGNVKLYYEPCLACKQTLPRTPKNTSKTKPKKIKTTKSETPKKLKTRKFEISKEDLELLLSLKSYGNIGDMFGVSGNAIKRRCRVLGIDLALAKFAHKKTKFKKDSA